MKPTVHRTRFALLMRRYLPWVLVYLFVIGGTTAFGATMYDKYETYRLPSGSIELSVDKTAYQLGETITFTVTNHFPVPIYVTNQCPKEPLNVYRWEEETWIPLYAQSRDADECPEEERDVAIESEESRSYTFNDWPELFEKPGVYRIAAEIDHSNDIPFQDFVVLIPPETIEVVDPPEIRYVDEAPKPTASVPTPLPVFVPAPVVEPTYEDFTYEEYDDEEEDEEYDDEDEEDEEDDDD